jgi:hypothetical protein
MKANKRVTIVVCISAAGEKVPLLVVGKSKTPHCFRLPEAKPLPVAYFNQQNAWFDKKVTLHWINEILWPWWTKKYGAKKRCVLILDN